MSKKYYSKRNPLLYVGNLDYDVTNRDLIKSFRKFGEIIDVRLKPAGYAFIEFADTYSVFEAITEMHGRTLFNS